MHSTVLIVAVIFSILLFRIRKEMVNGDYLGGYEDEGNRLIFMLNTPKEDDPEFLLDEIVAFFMPKTPKKDEEEPDIPYFIRENFSGGYLFVVDNSDDRFGKFKIISIKDIEKNDRNKAKKGKTLVRLRNSFIIEVR